MPDTEFEAAEKRLAAAYEKIEAEEKTEKKPLTYTRFRALLSDTQNHSTVESYIEAHPDTEERILSALWGFRDGITVKKIRSLSEMTQMKMSMEYSIPKRSIESWEQPLDSGKDTGKGGYRRPARTEPEYLDYLILFAVLSDLSEN